MNSLLIATPNEQLGKELRTKFDGYETEFVTNGRDCQIRMSKRKFFILLLDIDLVEHSALEVLTFTKSCCPSIKVVLMVSDRKKVDAGQLGMNPLLKAGIADVIYGPLTIEKIKKALVSLEGLDRWKNTAVNESADKSEAHIKARDIDFMNINIEDFYSGNITVFDHYIKLGPNNYKKVLNKGDVFDPVRLKKYVEEGVTHLYLLKTDRLSYINFINALVKNTLHKQEAPEGAEVMLPLRSITVKYLEEVYTAGLKPDLIEEGKAICQNMFEYIRKDKSIAASIDELQHADPSSYNHAFLVTFFSIFICRHLDWAGKRTIDTIALGALLHDIGILSLPAAIRLKKESELNPEQLLHYKQHPKLGVELVKRSPLINEQVLQIIQEHHEYIDGTGYPNQLSNARIYPLAKIVSLSNVLSDIILDKKITPKLALKEMLSTKDSLQRFDPLLVKSLAKGILNHEE